VAWGFCFCHLSSGDGCRNGADSRQRLSGLGHPRRAPTCLQPLMHRRPFRASSERMARRVGARKCQAQGLSCVYSWMAPPSRSMRMILAFDWTGPGSPVSQGPVGAGNDAAGRCCGGRCTRRGHAWRGGRCRSECCRGIRGGRSRSSVP